MDGHRDQLTATSDSSFVCSSDVSNSLAADDRREAASPSAAKRIPSILNAEEVFIAEQYSSLLQGKKNECLQVQSSSMVFRGCLCVVVTALFWAHFGHVGVRFFGRRNAILAKGFLRTKEFNRSREPTDIHCKKHPEKPSEKFDKS